jgi:hypothetical protein
VVILGHEAWMNYFSCSGGSGVDPTKSSSGHIVQSGASEARNIDTLFSCLGGPGADCTKSVAGHIMSNLRFYIRVDLRVT